MPDIEIGVTYKTLRALGCMSGAWVLAASAASGPAINAATHVPTASKQLPTTSSSEFIPAKQQQLTFGLSSSVFASLANGLDANHSHMARVFLLNPPYATSLLTRSFAFLCYPIVGLKFNFSLSAINEDPGVQYEDNVLYMSPTLLFNLGMPPNR
jgi:hypothetical protein